MAFDEKLAERIRKHLPAKKGLTEKKMFGGLAFLLGGNMCCGVHRSELIVRLDPAQDRSVHKDVFLKKFQCLFSNLYYVKCK